MSAKDVESAFKQTRRLFGFGAFKECWDKFVVPLNSQSARLQDTALKYAGEADELAAQLKEAKSEVVKLEAEILLLREGNKALINQKIKEEEAAMYVVEHSDPARYIYDPYFQSFKSYEDAFVAYHKMKYENGTSEQESLELYKKVTLKKVKTEYVQKK